MSEDRKRFSVTLPLAYVEVLDKLVKAGVYLDHQDAFRDALRRIFQYHEMPPFYPEGPPGEDGEEADLHE